MENAEKNKGRGAAITSFILGIIGLFIWLWPFIGAIVTIVGLILGIKGIKRKYKGLAITGIILCSIGLLVTIIYAIYRISISL